MADLLSYFDHNIPFVCMAGSEKENGFYGNYIHEACIYHEFNKEKIEENSLTRSMINET